MADLTLKAVADRRDFWARLKGRNEIDRTVYKYINANFYRSRTNGRKKQVAELQKKLIALYKSKYQAEAIELGTQAARRFVDRIQKQGQLRPLTNRRLRRAILKKHNLSIKSQFEVFRHSIRREAQHKLLEVETFFMESKALNRKKKDVVKQLADMHDREHKAVREAQAKGKSPRRVRSFAARFDVAVKGIIRDSVRRTAQQAEFYEFKQSGLGTRGFVWVAVNGSQACPDCNALHGTKMNEGEWDSLGHPGSGSTVCGAACMCALEPVEYVEGNKALTKPLQYKEPVELRPAQMKQANSNRI